MSGRGSNGTRRATAIGLALALAGLVCWFVGLGVWEAAARDGRARDERHQVRDVHLVRKERSVADPGDPAADDGELHDARTAQEGYELTEHDVLHDEVEYLDAYELDVRCTFAVRYPQLEGDLEHLDAINALLAATASETVRTYYDDPSAETVAKVRKLAEDGAQFVPEGADALLGSNVDYAVTYNSENLLSVCFSDECYLGTEATGFMRLRTVNVDLQTGESYQLADVLEVDRDLAASFVDNLMAWTGEDADGDGMISDDECLTVAIAGREAFEQAICGEGELVPRVQDCLFVDGNGRPNLGVSYWVSGDGGFVRGWWDVTLTREQEERLRRDSSLWELL